MANYSTGITINCPVCAATSVPVKAGFKARVHAVGKPFTQQYGRAGKCTGPNDTFLFLLAESRMALTGDGSRYATIDEMKKGLRVGPAVARH